MARKYPTSWKGIVFIAAAIAAIVVIVFAATTGGILLGLAIIALGALVAYALGYRLDRILKEKRLYGGDR